MKIVNLVKFTFVLVIVIAIGAYAHSGRTDSSGGHNNRKTGGYHYHNAGHVHAAGNPYQDHTKCGVCSKSEKPDSEEKKMTKALQAGLKCMGYKISAIDGVMGKETKEAIIEYNKDH